MNKKLLVPYCMMCVLFIFAITSCARPPVKEIADAEAALQAAREAEAPTYVPEEYKSAESLLAEAKSIVDLEECKRYGEARVDAINAKEKAEMAKLHAEEAKKRAMENCTQAIAKAKLAQKRAQELEANVYAETVSRDALNALRSAENCSSGGEYLDCIAKAELAKQLFDRAAEEAIAAKAEEEMKLKAIAEAGSRLPTNHVVVRGECLWIIAGQEEIYDDPFQWPLIYRANKDQIKDPDLIYPDQNFNISRNVSREEISSAVRFAKTRGEWSLYDGE